MISVNDVSLQFGQRKLFSNVNIIFSPGNCYGLIGANGSGKSTLLNAVAGTFLTDTGSIILKGKDITKWSEHKRASQIGRVFQKYFRGRGALGKAGAGLGLYLVDRIAQMHGGRVKVQTMPDHGSRFTLILPGPGLP